jgi:hypothetical protein
MSGGPRTTRGPDVSTRLVDQALAPTMRWSIRHESSNHERMGTPVKYRKAPPQWNLVPSGYRPRWRDLPRVARAVTLRQARPWTAGPFGGVALAGATWLVLVALVHPRLRGNLATVGFTTVLAVRPTTRRGFLRHKPSVLGAVIVVLSPYLALVCVAGTMARQGPTSVMGAAGLLMLMTFVAMYLMAALAVQRGSAVDGSRRVRARLTGEGHCVVYAHNLIGPAENAGDGRAVTRLVRAMRGEADRREFTVVASVARQRNRKYGWVKWAWLRSRLLERQRRTNAKRHTATAKLIDGYERIGFVWWDPENPERCHLYRLPNARRPRRRLDVADHVPGLASGGERTSQVT